MKFMIISKKEGFDENQINDSILSSTNATSLISDNSVKLELENLLVYLYNYNHVYDEKEGYSYSIDDNSINIINGLINIDNKPRPKDINEAISLIRENKKCIGDYQVVSLDSNGNGFFKTPLASIYPLFYYENNQCSIIANELKLIVDGVYEFTNKRFVESYDLDYIRTIFREGNFSKKSSIRNTAFRKIKRILPQDELTLENGKLIIKKTEDIEVPDWFEKWYFENKDSLYDWYYENLVSYTDSFISSFKDELETIVCPITGGFDSRLSLLILSKICAKNGIELKTYTQGLPDHPDVVLGKKIADVLNIDWENPQWEGKSEDSTSGLKPKPHHFTDYADTFYTSQGDYNSHTFEIDNTRKLDKSNSIFQHGMNLYKKEDISQIINYNRWYSRRVLRKNIFYLPLLGTEYELMFSRLYNKHNSDTINFRELIYNVLKRGDSRLLEIPFDHDKLPQTGLEIYTGNNTVVAHKNEPYLWDYNFVYNELNPLFKESFNKKDDEYDNILSKTGINSLDYFILEESIDNILEKDEKVESSLIDLKVNAFYPKYRTNIKVNNFHNRSLHVLMEYASAASFNSFEELEKNALFYLKKHETKSPCELEIKEKYYKEIGCINSNFYSNLLNELKEDKKKIEYYEIKNKKLKKKLKKAKKLNNELKNSSSWKITKPLRKIKNLKKDD